MQIDLTIYRKTLHIHRDVPDPPFGSFSIRCMANTVSTKYVLTFNSALVAYDTALYLEVAVLPIGS